MAVGQRLSTDGPLHEGLDARRPYDWLGRSEAVSRESSPRTERLLNRYARRQSLQTTGSCLLALGSLQMKLPVEFFWGAGLYTSDQKVSAGSVPLSLSLAEVAQ